MIKAVFFDIDGTLFSYSIQGIPPSAIKALKLLKEKNILCIIATGRHPKEVRLLPLHQMNMDGYVLLHWNSFVTDIIPSEGGKMKGIRKMLEHIHCSPDEIMAFGDGQNDADMLEFAGIGVAMGNGHPEAKKHADFITKDIDDDGIFYALKHFNII